MAKNDQGKKQAQPQQVAAPQPAEETKLIENQEQKAQDQQTGGVVDQQQNQDPASNDVTGETSNQETGEQSSGDAQQSNEMQDPQNDSSETPPAETKDESVVAAVASEEVEEVKPVKVGDGTDPIIANALPLVSVAGQIILHRVEEYMNKMAHRKPVSVEEGVRQQVVLYRSLVTTINTLVGKEFAIVFDAILALFNEHRESVFHETNLFRFTENMPLQRNDINTFVRLLNMLKLTADPKGRGTGLKQINMQATLSHGITDAGRKNVQEYFDL